MYDLGWIENGQSSVGNDLRHDIQRRRRAKKSCMIDATITLEKGEYELHYETDGSHSFNDWNDDPPEDREHWGITLYKDR